MLEKAKEELEIYWANLCILNRMEAEKMEKAAKKWESDNSYAPKMVYLGDTEEVKMYEKMDMDMAKGKLGFDLLISSRFDLFCSNKYLQSHKDELYPLGDLFPVREEVRNSGVVDPSGLFHPLVILPHFTVVNTKLVEKKNIPGSLEDLLDPSLAGKVFLGATELPSAKSILFAMWYKFGKKGLETCVRNWRQKSAPSAARHGLVKDEIPIALLPGIFAGPGPDDKLIAVRPKEGAPVLPSYAAVRKSDKSEAIVDFITNSVARPEFVEFYRDQALAFPSDPSIEPPELLGGEGSMFFPDWDWVMEQDMEYFDYACERVPFG